MAIYGTVRSIRKNLAAWALSLALGSFLAPTVAVQAGGLDLSGFAVESYPIATNFVGTPFPDAVWELALDNLSVTQTENGQPTFYVSDFTAGGKTISFEIDTMNFADNDILGFALGFQSGDTTSAGADYLLVDWVAATQGADFGINATPASLANVGLAVSRVSGVPTSDELWGHVDFPDPSGSVTELARGNTLGSTGFESNANAGGPYQVELIFLSANLTVWLNGVLELSVDGTFDDLADDGALAFYNFSQPNIRFQELEYASLPEPSTGVLFGLALLGTALASRRR